MKIGIDRLSVYTSKYFIDLKTLAEQRSVESEKYYLGLGQERMSVPAPDEDVVTMGANAAYPLKQAGELEEVELLLFATESGIDQSKSAGVFVHRLLGLSPRCRTIELKQACYSGTAAVQLAKDFVQAHPEKKALVIAADIARYDLESPGEATQGCGAVALTISTQPRTLSLDDPSGYYTEDVMDFWRPNYRSEALVDGKYSTQVYMRALEACWTQYSEQTGRSIRDFDFYCYHIPFTKMAEKGHRRLARVLKESLSQEDIDQKIGPTLTYSKQMGNCYTASMYMGLASLLGRSDADISGKRLGFFSYGSGCVAEFFSGTIEAGYRSVDAASHASLLSDRIELSYQQYEDIFNYQVPTDGGDYTFPIYATIPFRMQGVHEHKREYEKVVD
jgi:hydroxymethylglutaryl-CoA synthase